MLRSVGSWGWRYPEWEKDIFYPDDLPSDWQLSYYSNEFDLVVVPAAYWTSEGYGDEDWLDDVEQDFVFYVDWPFLQLADQADYARCAEACRQLGGQMTAVLINNETWQQLNSEQRDWFETQTKAFTILQYGAKSIAGYLQLADDQGSGPTESLANENLVLLHSDASESLRDLSQRIMPLLQGAAFKHIILANNHVEITRLKELHTLMSLLPAAL